MAKKIRTRYKRYKGKILSSVYKNASNNEKKFSNKALNKYTERAMKSTHKQNKMAIRQIQMEHREQNSQMRVAGQKPMKMFWITKARIKILQKVNRGKQNYARTRSRRKKK